MGAGPPLRPSQCVCYLCRCEVTWPTEKIAEEVGKSTATDIIMSQNSRGNSMPVMLDVFLWENKKKKLFLFSEM